MEPTWQPHYKTAVQWLRPYIPGEDMTGISVQDGDTPEEGGWIGMNPHNIKDRWYVSKEYYEINYQKADI